VNAISVNLITLDEERNIARCLESLSWASEIVVIDSGSKDATVDIASRYTDRVLAHPFDDYASQRNRALERSRGDWILSIDADERVPESLASEMRQAVAGAAADCHGFWIPIRSRIFGRQFRHCGMQAERKMRLFRRESACWEGAVHETVALRGDAGTLRHAIDHESTPDLNTYLRKLVRYSSLEADRAVRDGRIPRWWHAWARPLARFAQLYVWKMGLLDGPEGLRFCMLSAWQEWIVHHQVIERYRALKNGMRGCEFEGEQKETWHGPVMAAATV
jgi:glycosyltransferase involved in cell wall biosynthesis